MNQLTSLPLSIFKWAAETNDSYNYSKSACKAQRQLADSTALIGHNWPNSFLIKSTAQLICLAGVSRYQL